MTGLSQLTCALPVHADSSNRDGDRFKIKVDVRLEGGLVGSQERGDYFDPKVLQAVETKLASEIQKAAGIL